MTSVPDTRISAFESTALAVLFLFSCAAMSGCGGKEPTAPHFELAGETMGTTYHIKVVLRPKQEIEGDLKAKVDARLNEINALMSTYQEDSELSRFNQQRDSTPFPLSPETAGVLRIALEVSAQSGGAFDVTIGPLVNAYGFGPEVKREIDDAARATLMERVGYQKLSLDAEGNAAKQHPELYCDLSAVAKGYASDAIADLLEENAIFQYIVEIGGEVAARGRNERGKPWRLGIERPEEGAFGVLQEIVAMSGDRQRQALATSGDYRNFYMEDGKRISHTIDARTGKPIEHTLASASVLHASCAWADAYATAMMALGPDEGMVLAEAQGLSVYFVLHDGEGFTTAESAAWTRHRESMTRLKK
jgi:thiamine biosynthesis lipoprotein